METRRILIFVILCVSHIYLFSQEKPQTKIGVYYFDGWTGKTAHITKTLTSEYTERAPIGGWVTSTPSGISKQIKLAADAGISFFNFCWYYNGGQGGIANDPKNNALKLYLRSKNKTLIDFSILVANHNGYVIKSQDWMKLVNFWSELFKDSSYVKIGGKPLITFLSVTSLIKTFGKPALVKNALNQFRNEVIKDGLNGLDIAICLDDCSEESIKLAKQCGFDILTSYNLHGMGLKDIKKQEVEINNVVNGDAKGWNDLVSYGNLPVIPTITLNWDKRPMEVKGKYSRRYVGYSGESVKQSIINCRKWITQNNKHMLVDNIVFMYAWNEYAEGAWLTPSKVLGKSLLNGVKQGIKSPIK